MYSDQINFIPICFNTSIEYRVKPTPYYVLKHSICKKWAYTLIVVLLHKTPSKSCTWHLFIEFLQYFIWKIEEEKKTHQTLAFAFKRKLNVNKKSIAQYFQKKNFLSQEGFPPVCFIENEKWYQQILEWSLLKIYVMLFLDWL